MPEIAELISDSRLAYEVALGRRVTDNHWYRTRKLLQSHGLEVNAESVQFFAQIRRVIPRSAIGVSGILTCHQRATELLSQTTKPLKGSEVLAMLRQYGVAPHQTTVSRWFRPLGGYRRDRGYPPVQLKSIFTQAFLYKAQQSSGLPQGVNCG